MTVLQKILLRGLIVTLPMTLTIIIIFWIIAKLDSLLHPFLTYSLGPRPMPGLGVLAAVLLLLIIGLVVDNYLVAKLWRFISHSFEKIPLVKAIYGPLKDLLSMLGSHRAGEGLQRVVRFEWKPGIYLVGLVTRDQFEHLGADQLMNEELVAVYVPHSFMVGGVTYLIQKKLLQELPIKVDQAIKLAVTGWIAASSQDRIGMEEGSPLEEKGERRQNPVG